MFYVWHCSQCWLEVLGRFWILELCPTTTTSPKPLMSADFISFYIDSTWSVCTFCLLCSFTMIVAVKRVKLECFVEMNSWVLFLSLRQSIFPLFFMLYHGVTGVLILIVYFWYFFFTHRHKTSSQFVRASQCFQPIDIRPDETPRVIKQSLTEMLSWIQKSR